MNAKHLVKNSILKKALFFATCVGILMVALLSVSTSQKADAQTTYDFNEVNENTPNGIIKGPGGDGVTYEMCEILSTNIVQITGKSKDNICDYLKESDLFKQSLTHINETIFKVHQEPLDDKTDDLGLMFEDSHGYGSEIGEYSVGMKFSVPRTSSDEGVYTGTYSIDDGELAQVPKEGDSEGMSISDIVSHNIVFQPAGGTDGYNVAGHVVDAEDPWKPVPGAFVQYYHRTLWGDIPVPEKYTFTDWLGNYSLEGIEEDMLPGVVKAFRNGYEVGESGSIWTAPEGEDTIYRFIEMTPQQPDPPVPPTPPDPPIPPGPVPPEPVPPEPVPPAPPTPVPTPDNPGGGIAQTGDATGYAFAAFAMLALISAGVLASRKLYIK